MRPAALVRCRCAGAAARALAAYEKLSCCVSERSSCARCGLVLAPFWGCLIALDHLRPRQLRRGSTLATRPAMLIQSR